MTLLHAQDSKGDKASVSLATGGEPVGGCALISAGTQTDAILVQNVGTALAMPVTAGGSTVLCCFQIFAVLISALLLVLLQI